jgi:hypothetical protein
MTDSTRRLVGLGLPCLLAFLLDTSLALFGESGIIEHRLVFITLYKVHPLAAAGGYFVWAVLVAGLLLILPGVLAVILAIVLVFGHMAGAYTQLVPILAGVWYQAANGTFLIAAIALGTGLHWWLRGRPGARARPLVTGWRRWALIAVLSVAWGVMAVVPVQGG